jgi:hypothetical protein
MPFQWRTAGTLQIQPPPAKPCGCAPKVESAEKPAVSVGRIVCKIVSLDGAAGTGRFPPGRPLRLSISLVDATPGSPTHGTAQDPGRLTLTVGPPRGRGETVIWPRGRIVRDSPGEFHYDLTPEAGGRWPFTVVTAGDFAAVTEQMWFLVR